MKISTGSCMAALIDAYAELYCKTNFSFLTGASHPDELVLRATELDYRALAITDVNTLAGVVRAHAAAKAAGLKLIVGAEITPEDAPAVLLYAADAAAYRNLSRLITRGRRAAPKGECKLTFQDVADHAGGVVAAVIGRQGSGIRRQETRDRRQETGDRIQGSGIRKRESGGRQLASDPCSLTPDPCLLSRVSCLLSPVACLRYRELFPGRCYLATSVHHGPDDAAQLERHARLAREASLPLLATNDVYYHDPGRRHLQDVLTAIRHGKTVATLGGHRFANAERHLKAPAQMAKLFKDYPQALAHVQEVVERCTFSMAELRYDYPEEICPAGLSPQEHLAALTWAGARERYPDGVSAKVTMLLERELALIEELHYQAYFLTVWDLVRFARQRGILCQGRGSAANSAVCYCLGITSVDPDRSDMLFERFISRERQEAPDIDVDFEHERREEVLQYIYQKYGRDRAGIVAEVITYRPRSSVRDVGKALGLSLDAVDRLAKTLDPYADAATIPARLTEAGLDPKSPGAMQLVRLSRELLCFPRHLSQHVGGFVITGGPLSELVPIENAAMPERTVIQWDKDDLDALGILKVDCLSLGMLTAIHKTFDLVARHHGTELTLASVPAEDSDVYEMICRADTIGVFQIESRAQMSMLPRLLPKCFYDLVIEVAIIRPGPIQGGMVHPFLRRRNGQEPVTYPNPIIEKVLSKTLGVPLFQEQAMRLAMVAAGFTAGEADQLRRAMGAWRRPGLIEQFRTKFRDGMLARGLPVDFADQLYEQIRGFGEYGFPESHAASFALLAYISAWLKHHYPAAFTAALLNSQPMGFYAPAQLVRDAKEHGVVVYPVDVNHSEWDCTMVRSKESGIRGQEAGVRNQESGGRNQEAGVRSHELEDRIPDPCFLTPDSCLLTPDSCLLTSALQLGLRLIKGFPQATAVALSAARQARPFRSINDLARRVELGRPLLARLAAADAFGSLGLGRRAALWQVLSLGEELPLFTALDDYDVSPPLAEMPLSDEVNADYQTTGLSLKAHPISLVRRDLDKLRVISAAALKEVADKATVRVAGLVLVRQQPSTSKGTIFITLEDETGTVNLVIWPRIWQRFRPVIRGAVALLAQGKVEHASSVIHVIPGTLEDLSQSLRGLVSRSRDFH
jgi:error-prone DNA polymerase